MKLMMGREYLSKIRRKASASPWHTRVTRSTELFIRVPANVPVIALGRLVKGKHQKLQVFEAGAGCRGRYCPAPAPAYLPRFLVQKLFWVDDLPSNRGRGDDVR